MAEGPGDILLGLTGLLTIAAVSLWLTVARIERSVTPAVRRKLQVLAALVLTVQFAHFTEEFIAGFHVRFPELLRLAPWPVEFFVSFNLFWIVVWGVSVLGLGRQIPGALFPVWFLAVGSAVNGIAHPAMALADGGYFPGLLTSPLSGIAGMLLLRSLTGFTETRSMKSRVSPE